jgi:hypothetical protein
MVPVYFQYFASTATPLTSAAILAYTIWTFATEIPFLLALGPPIIGVIYLAFPSLKPKGTPEEQ